jgi:hypothetical protein
MPTFGILLSQPSLLSSFTFLLPLRNASSVISVTWLLAFAFPRPTGYDYNFQPWIVFFFFEIIMFVSCKRLLSADAPLDNVVRQAWRG